MKARGAKPSLWPQNITSDVWYYENRGNIEVLISADALRKQPADLAFRFKIPKYRLERSLRRMRGHAK